MPMMGVNIRDVADQRQERYWLSTTEETKIPTLWLDRGRKRVLKRNGESQQKLGMNWETISSARQDEMQPMRNLFFRRRQVHSTEGDESAEVLVTSEGRADRECCGIGAGPRETFRTLLARKKDCFWFTLECQRCWKRAPRSEAVAVGKRGICPSGRTLESV